MGYLKVDEAGASHIATLLKSNAAARESDLRSLSCRVSPSAVWEGAAATAYEEKYQQWRTAEANLIRALGDLGQVVQQIIQNFTAVDHQGASALSDS
jgi:WXG100 family type VII secretion target